MDILPAGVSKGTALERLAATRGWGPAQVMAIGDNWNDLPMLHVAGTPVLMGNAPVELREMARGLGWWLAPTNDRDGVAEARGGAMVRNLRLAAAEPGEPMLAAAAL